MKISLGSMNPIWKKMTTFNTFDATKSGRYERSTLRNVCGIYIELLIQQRLCLLNGIPVRDAEYDCSIFLRQRHHAKLLQWKRAARLSKRGSLVSSPERPREQEQLAWGRNGSGRNSWIVHIQERRRGPRVKGFSFFFPLFLPLPLCSCRIRKNCTKRRAVGMPANKAQACWAFSYHRPSVYFGTLETWVSDLDKHACSALHGERKESPNTKRNRISAIHQRWWTQVSRHYNVIWSMYQYLTWSISTITGWP